MARIECVSVNLRGECEHDRAGRCEHVAHNLCRVEGKPKKHPAHRGDGEGLQCHRCRHEGGGQLLGRVPDEVEVRHTSAKGRVRDDGEFAARVELLGHDMDLAREGHGNQGPHRAKRIGPPDHERHRVMPQDPFLHDDEDDKAKALHQQDAHASFERHAVQHPGRPRRVGQNRTVSGHGLIGCGRHRRFHALAFLAERHEGAADDGCEEACHALQRGRFLACGGGEDDGHHGDAQLGDGRDKGSGELETPHKPESVDKIQEAERVERGAVITRREDYAVLVHRPTEHDPGGHELPAQQEHARVAVLLRCICGGLLADVELTNYDVTSHEHGGCHHRHCAPHRPEAGVATAARF
mmetsp:Transcript_114161/g.322825  ORF Transcript_114161/g.322825 Transcript_114161/m.322825 type:complete len:353 (-) Transcript_114161:142-1200(-)